MPIHKIIKSTLPFLTVAFAAAVALNASHKPVPPVPPELASITSTSAIRPTFHVAGQRPFDAGTGFVTTYGKGKGQMLVTALHLLGPAGGLSGQIPGNQLSRYVRKVEGAQFTDGKLLVQADVPMTRSGFALDERGIAKGDIAAFRVVKNSGATVLKLAARNPKPGEWVWVLGDLATNRKQALRPYPAKVSNINAEGLNLVEPSNYNFMGFSGSPIVNAKAEVVGILIGGDDKGSIVANDVESMKRYLPAP